MKKTRHSRFAVKCFAALMSVAMCFAAVGCGGGNNNPGGNTGAGDRLQLNVVYYDFGFGGGYVNELAKRFEELYKDVQIGDKTGVFVNTIAERKDDIFKNAQLMKQRTDIDVAFAENMFYDTLANNGALMDVSDVVNETSKYDNKTIASKMNNQQKSYLTRDGAIYAVPNYASSYGIIYNIDLFEKNNWYFKDGYKLPDGYNEYDAICDYGVYQSTNINGMFVSSPVDKKTAGPDGVYDTEDDGLPCTYDEFFWLCKKIVQTNESVPMVWTGNYFNDYLCRFLKSLLADAEGLDNYIANYDPVGKTAEDLVEIDDDGNVTVLAGQTLTSADAANIRLQKGLYDGLRFINMLVGVKEYHWERAFDESSSSQYDAQRQFLLSYADDGIKDIAMLLDGAWWENEAKDDNAFAEIESLYGAGNCAKRFGWLTLPKVSKAAYEESKQVYCADSLNAFVVIRNGVTGDKAEIAKDFVRYACSDESLQAFTVVTGALKAFDYTLSDANYKKLTDFGKAYYDAMKNKITKPTFVYSYANSALYASNPDYFYTNFYNVGATTGVVKSMQLASEGGFKYANAKTAFNDIYKYAQTMMNGKV